jgi:hypothetical protein
LTIVHEGRYQVAKILPTSQQTSVTSNATADDSSFRVLIDGKPVNYSEGKETDAEFREITSFIPRGSKYVEIIGTSSLPSSSSLASNITE